MTILTGQRSVNRLHDIYKSLNSVKRGGSKTGLKIKLNVGAAKLKHGGTGVSTPGETPPFAMPRAKRVNKRKTVGAPSRYIVFFD